MTLLALCLGAALGAPLRYMVEVRLRARWGAFPWGTLAVNVVGSAVLGVLAGASATRGVPPAVVSGVGAGFCGALTTYSGFAAGVVRLTEEDGPRSAALDVALHLLLGLGAATAGYAAAVALA